MGHAICTNFSDNPNQCVHLEVPRGTHPQPLWHPSLPPTLIHPTRLVLVTKHWYKSPEDGSCWGACWPALLAQEEAPALGPHELPACDGH